MILREIYRKLFHAIGLIYPISYICMYNRIQMSIVAILLFIIAFMFEFIRLNIPLVNNIFCKSFSSLLRDHENDKINGMLYFTLGAMISILFFQKNIAILSLFVLVICDTCASIIGILYGKTKLIGNKSLEGTAAFFLSAFFISLIGGYCFNIRIHPLLIGSVVATILELFSKKLKIDDNVLIPVGYGLPSILFI